MITQLTKNAIDLLTNSCSTEEQYVIQVIQEPKSVAENLYKSAISDGFALTKNVYFVSEAAQKCETLKELSIIKCKKYVDEQTQESKKRIIIQSYEEIYTNVTDLIGKPIDYKLYKQSGFVNTDGTSVIPQKYLSRNAQALQQNQATQPKQITPTNNNSFIKNTPTPQANNNVQKPLNNESLNRVNQNPNSTNKPVYQNNQSMQNMSLPNESDEKNLDSIQSLYPGLNPSSFKARITKKGELKKFQNQKSGEGVLFSIDVIDKDNNETTITFFGEQANKYHHYLNVGLVFIFKNGGIKVNPNTQYNKGKHVVTINKDSQIFSANDDGQIPRLNLNVKTISDAQSMNKNDSLDLICVVKEDSQCKDMPIKDGTIKSRRDIAVFDQSLIETEVTLWGEIAQEKDAKKGDIVIFKDARIGEFNGKKQINISFGSQVFLKPDPQQFPQIFDLQNWYDNYGERNLSNIQKITPEGGNVQNVGFEQCLSILADEIEETKMNIRDDTKIWKEVRAQVLFIKDTPLYYNSCLKCKKKAIPDGEQWRCTGACNQSFDEPESRYISTFLIGDSTQTHWVSAFDEVCRIIFGRPANDFRYAEQNTENGIEIKKKYIQQAQNQEFRFLLLTKAEKMENNGNLILKTVIQSIKDTKPALEAKRILHSLEKYLQFAEQ